ncbi:hypothetical protein A1D23_02885 [Chelonobacter oris]|uniref:Uncharacterized protein n=2 Tax=Chelonobacter oris TaxID=505317 RepID=A0A0A3APY4_9PAST|nr:hypothetical protein OA57_00675 [Chelonobacter oris]MDH3001538.1 hypothetical protein [Chelonobacter oris]
MRIDGIGCFVTVIAVFLFALPTEQIMDYLTALGAWLNAGTTVGIFAPACLPVFVSTLCYWIYYRLKNG